MSIQDILGEHGLIARRLAAYELRPQQIEMAEAVAETLENGGVLLAEAGTGVGKSFAYLVPAIQHILQNGGRVVISTHTIALQEQLMEKDLPFLREVFGNAFSAVLVKGRSNYLGLRRLARTSQRQQILFDNKSELAELHALEDWAYTTSDGTLSDLPAQPSLKVWESIRSDGDDCLGKKCPTFERCFYQRARRRMAEAQLLIVNHALLFSDLKLRQAGASILPDYEMLVLDEAHTAEAVAGDHLGSSVSNTQIRFLLNRLHNDRTGRGILQHGPGKRIIPAVSNAHRMTDQYFSRLLEWRLESGKESDRICEPPCVDETLSAELLAVRDGLRETRSKLSSPDDQLEMQGMMQRIGDLAEHIDYWHRQRSSDWVYWLESGGERRRWITLAARPIDVAPQLGTMLFSQMRATVLTSATLNTDSQPTFSYLRERLGLNGPRMLALGSPFDYENQLQVFVEAGMPDPQSPEFMAAACSNIRKYVLRTEGRAFVLFTSFEMLRQCAELMKDFFAAHELPLWVHGSGLPRTQMLNRFRRTPRSVLFGTDTFWAGVDVPGDALSNVILVKIPFAVPNHPVIEARIEQLQQAGRNPFMEFQLPEAILKFRQGIGRLIRTRSDRGIIVILDPRVITKSYGRQFLSALPKAPVEIVRERPSVFAE